MSGWMYLVAAGIPLAIATPAAVIGIRQTRRANRGLDLITNSKIHPYAKLHLLNQWISPYASKKQMSWLVKLIAELEKKAGEGIN